MPGYPHMAGLVDGWPSMLSCLYLPMAWSLRLHGARQGRTTPMPLTSFLASLFEPPDSRLGASPFLLYCDC